MLPAVKLGEVVRPHQPDETDTGMQPGQRLQRLGGVARAQPGLGVVLDEKVALAHPYDGDELHLEAGGDPMPVAEGLTPDGLAAE